ncbi:MAG TPA: hypothetical protein VLN42_09675 [Casimicrobiaceae bacterium]|nr:hypothetical protein [Casimicrobiaceae bacterium]
MSSRIDFQRSNECASVARSEFDALLATRCAPQPTTLRADELLEWIEDSDCPARLVPELNDDCPDGALQRSAHNSKN